jgi:hypothetical protein
MANFVYEVEVSQKMHSRDGGDRTTKTFRVAASSVLKAVQATVRLSRRCRYTAMERRGRGAKGYTVEVEHRFVRHDTKSVECLGAFHGSF